MSNEANVIKQRKPLRVWPGVAIAALMLLFKLLVPFFGTNGPPLVFLGGLAGGAIIILWWLLFSRARWMDRLWVVVLMAVAMVATQRFLHDSIASAGMGRLFPILAIPTMALALVLAAVVTRRASDRLRRVTIALAVVMGSALFALLRGGGVSGEGKFDFQFRWGRNAEERLVAQTRDERLSPPPAAPAPTPAAPVAAPAATPKEDKTPAGDPKKTAPPQTEGAVGGPATSEPGAARRVEWPGFRGRNRDNVITGTRISTDWSAVPPSELWRKPVGPGWSSFAVDGDFIYTQEQRGDDEIVSCYRFSTGAPVWRHRDKARFYEFVGGPGPRATPTLHAGRVYTHGATGIVNALDAATGARLWSRNSAQDTGTADPGWGFTSSPLVVNDMVVVAASGALVAYDLATGAPRWKGPEGGGGYSSPHFAVLDGVPQILLLRGRRTTSVSPDDGKMLWEHAWQPGGSIVQPAVIGPRDLLINTSDTMGGQGMRRLTVTRGANGWNVEERWTSRGLKPYYNDFVAHGGFAYGFDGNILSCIDVNNGERKWKGGRYGHGQMLLLREQGLLLVLSEDGDLAIVKASPDQFTEVTRFKVLEGKTWNHPVLVGDVLLVRNGEEMAAFRLSRAAATN